jgi:hypothetical protein
MTLTRAFKRLVCLGLIGQMLFSQLAIAAYACPALSYAGGQSQPLPVTALGDQATPGDSTAGKTASLAADRRVDCDQMAGHLDKTSPELCVNHCDYGQQIDQVQAPAVPPIVLISLYVVAPKIHQAFPPMSAIAASVDTPAVACPPHAILHCCLRI